MIIIIPEFAAMDEESGRVYIVQKNNVTTLETVITS